jgi:hypothetical protein
MPDGEAQSPPDATETSFIRLAEAHRREGLVQDAIRICREGLQRLPTSLRGRIVLGQCLLDQGAIGEAIVELGRVERDGRDDPEILALLCGVHLGEPHPWPVGADVAARSGAAGPTSGDGISDERAETSVLILETPDQAPSAASTSGVSESDPLASATLAGLYASQGDSATADAILRQITPEKPAPACPSTSDPGTASYLSELRRVREIAERLRKGQTR